MKIYYSTYGLYPRSGSAERVGVLLCFDFGFGAGYSSLQSWPELGDLSLSSLLQTLKDWCGSIPSSFSSNLNVEVLESRLPSLVRQALRMALLDAQARADGISLFRTERPIPQSHFLLEELGRSGPDRFAAILEDGFRVAKLKLGREPERELQLWKDWAADIPEEILFRFDFNYKLKRYQALDYFNKLPASIYKHIDFVEDVFLPEPCEASAWQEMQEDYKIRLAVDRVPQQQWDLGEYLQQIEPSVWVLKPAQQNILPGSEIYNSCVQRAWTREIVITSYMGHPLEQVASAYVASIWKSELPKMLSSYCGLLSDKIYYPNDFSEMLQNLGPKLLPPEGTGFGFDQLLARQDWKLLSHSGPGSSVQNSHDVPVQAQAQAQVQSQTQAQVHGLRSRSAAIDWDSTADNLLLNPRLPDEQIQVLQSAWTAGLTVLHQQKGDDSGYVGFQTSGSEGDPKLVVLNRKSLLASARAVNEHLQSDAHDVWLNVLPYFHVGGLGVHARSYLSGAICHDWSGKWDARLFHKKLETEGVTLTALVPTQVFDLVVEAQLPSPKSLRAVIVGGGRLSEELYFAARNLGWPLLPSFGMTECASQIATADLKSLLDNDTGGSGRRFYPDLYVLPHVEVTIEGSHSDVITVVPSCLEQGRLGLRSSALFAAYIDISYHNTNNARPSSIRQPQDAQGWFWTEDQVELLYDKQNGRTKLKPLGRSTDFLKIGGESFHWLQLQKAWEWAVEEELRINPSTLSALSAQNAEIMPVPDARSGALIHLLVTRNIPGEIVKNLVERYNKRVLPLAHIQKCHRVSEIPRSSLGKFQRHQALKELGV